MVVSKCKCVPIKRHEISETSVL